MLEAYLTSASSLDVKLKILIQTVMAEKRLIPQNKFDKSIILSDNGIRNIEGDALLNMKYKTCLENLDLSYNKFYYHGWLAITFLVLFNNLKSINFSGKLGMSKEFTMIGKSIALSFPNSIHTIYNYS
jgi:hypothetical protein